jgi:hypothetical protein
MFLKIETTATRLTGNETSITNVTTQFVFKAFIIAFTSEFIPKLVYKYRFSPDMTLNGYTDFTLSKFDPEDFGQSKPKLVDNPAICRYYDYRYPPEHESR